MSGCKYCPVNLSKTSISPKKRIYFIEEMCNGCQQRYRAVVSQKLNQAETAVLFWMDEMKRVANHLSV